MYQWTDADVVFQWGGTGGLIFFALVLMILFRQKYPRWWFDWNVALTKFMYRVVVYLGLLRDEYPSTDEEQAVHIHVEYPDVEKDLDRWLPLVKWFLAIPHYIVLAFLFVAVIVSVIIAGFAILFTGRYPVGLFDFVTGLFTESHSGNSIGPALKYAGYDHLVITGKASNPVLLAISDDDVQLHNASWLWGKNVFETSEAIRNKLGEDYQTSCIGQAGENQVRFACIVDNKHGMLGRTGLGAVAGSKNLKAIAVRGTKGITVHAGRSFRKLAEEMRRKVAASPLIDLWRSGGKIIDAYMEPFYKRGVYAKKNFSQGATEIGSRAFTRADFVNRVWKHYYACFGCPCGCKAIIGMEGNYAVPDFKISNPWGTPMLFIECGARDWDEAVLPVYLTNKYGMDSFETLRLIAFAIEIFQRGIINRQDTAGLRLEWNTETILALIEQIVSREGIGAILARGIKEACRQLPKDAEVYAVHIKGLHPTMDLRTSRSKSDRSRYLFLENFGQLVDPRGGHHARGWAITYVPRDISSLRKYAASIGMPKEEVSRIIEGPHWNLPRMLKWVNAYDTVAFCLGLCMRLQVMANYDLETLSEVYSLATGFAITPEEFLKAGERVWNLQRQFNVREGASRRDDTAPRRMVREPLKIGNFVNPPADNEYLESLLDEYYDESGWCIATGVPSVSKLEELGIQGYLR